MHRQVANNYVETVDSDKLKEHAIEGMLSGLDPFTQYVPPAKQEIFDRTLDGTFKGVGITLFVRDGHVIVESPIDDSPANKAGIFADDVIAKVDGIPIDKLFANKVIELLQAPTTPSPAPVGPVAVTVLRHTKPLELNVPRPEDGNPGNPKDGKVTILASPAASGDQGGLQPNDVLQKIDGDPIEAVLVESVSKAVTGPVGTSVNLTVLRDNKPIDFTISRQNIILPTVKGHERNKNQSWSYFVLSDPKIAYVRISQFDETTFDELKNVLVGESGSSGLLDQGMKGLILDLRWNPGGRLDQAVKIVNMFVKEGVIVEVKGLHRPDDFRKADGQGTLPEFPMIVLVNDQSASAAEIVSGSLKDHHRALILGQRTYGKGSVQEVIPLHEDGGELKLTVAHYFLPSGRLVQRMPGATDWGVEPQIIVPLSEGDENALKFDIGDSEIIHRPDAPATQPATTRPVDTQLQQAINTIVGLIVLDKNKPPTTQPVQ